MDRLQAEQTDRGMVMTLGTYCSTLTRPNSSPLVSAPFASSRTLCRSIPTTGYGSKAIPTVREAAYNQELSLSRAQAVENKLLSDGIDPDRVETQGFGEEYPKATNTTAAGRQENRRVEIVISDRDGNIGSR